MPEPAANPHCILESWDTARKTWVPVPAAYASIAAATAAAHDRGVYRVVVVNADRRLETDAFAIL